METLNYPERSMSGCRLAEAKESAGRPRILTHSRHPPPRSNERDNLQSLTAGEAASFTDESPLLGQRLSKIAHIRRALQKAKDPARWAPLASSTSFSAGATQRHVRNRGGEWKCAACGETLTPRAASSSFSPCSVRCGVWPIRSRTKARCGSSTRLRCPPTLPGATEPVAR